jgi:hypothetical protein
MKDFASHPATSMPAALDFANHPAQDVAAGDCDNPLLSLGRWWSGGGQCRDLDGLARLENSAAALDREIKRVVATDTTGSVIPNETRIQMGTDLVAWFAFDRRLRESGDSHWTSGSESGTQIIAQFDAHQKHIQGWRDWLASKTGHDIPGGDLPNPGLDPEPKPGILGGIQETLGSAAKLALIVIGGMVLLSLVRR